MALLGIFIILLVKILLTLALPVMAAATVLHKLADLSFGLSAAIAAGTWILYVWVGSMVLKRKRLAALAASPPAGNLPPV